ncbi:thiol peroxidase, atypical 2-Cys peroxiredoxin [Zhouia amylolytica]|nr:thiol peroxidase [Zhouia amylolytica]MCQ0112034.1 thiol peroxidase [Zhouia amylolytica]SFS54862.1 thiol peroxidase, atypical 2-Cys peroxiredoxin [Zhouia amylolytica]
MASVYFKGSPIHTEGELPKKGETAPNFSLVNGDLEEVTLDTYKGSKVVLNIFHSLDTGTCAASMHRFNKIASESDNTKVLCISKDLPFAMSRFCAAEGLNNVITLSDFRNGFGQNYKLTYTDGIIKGLLARAIVIIDENGKVTYTEQVQEVTEEPDYDSAIEALKNS